MALSMWAQISASSSSSRRCRWRQWDLMRHTHVQLKVISLLFHPCPLATHITAKRAANRAGHPGRGFNCALERNSESDPPVAFLFPAEHNFIPFHCADDFAWAERAGVIARQLFARLF